SADATRVAGAGTDGIAALDRNEHARSRGTRSDDSRWNSPSVAGLPALPSDAIPPCRTVRLGQRLEPQHHPALHDEVRGVEGCQPEQSLWKRRACRSTRANDQSSGLLVDRYEDECPRAVAIGIATNQVAPVRR